MASLELKQEIQEALKNQTLSRTLGTFCATYPAKREKSYAGVDFESTRDSIKEVHKELHSPRRTCFPRKERRRGYGVYP